VSSCPCGQAAGSSTRAIGRVTSKVVPHARHRTSYLGTVLLPLLCCQLWPAVSTPMGPPATSSVTGTRDT
jgi:hypothetical protein